MAITVIEQGSLLATTSEQTLGTAQTAAGIYQALIDLGPLVGDDELEVTVYSTVLAAGTERVFLRDRFQGRTAAAEPNLVTLAIPSNVNWRVTIRSTRGTARTHDWKTISLGAPTVVGSGTWAVAALGQVDTLLTDTTGKVYVLVVDGAPLVDGTDSAEFRQLTKVRSTSTERVYTNRTIGPMPDQHGIYQWAPVVADVSYKVQAKQVIGTIRSIPWKVYAVG